jgi:hypothetical protein
MKHKDFTYRKFIRKGETLWAIYAARTELQTICRTEKEAQIQTELFNRDPHWPDRQAWKQFIAARQ